MGPHSRLMPDIPVFDTAQSLEEAIQVAFLLETILLSAEADGPQHVRPVCNGLVYTTCN